MFFYVEDFLNILRILLKNSEQIPGVDWLPCFTQDEKVFFLIPPDSRVGPIVTFCYLFLWLGNLLWTKKIILLSSNKQ